jgi:hypothetical protein
MPLKVAILCEFSGTVRDAFRRLGHDAISCDLLPTEAPGPHIVGDCLAQDWSGYDLIVAHPPCTYLSRAGARWWREPGRKELADAAADFVFAIRDLPVPHIAIENPIGQLNTRWRYPDQTVQPWQFGHPFSKATCLWLKNLPPLIATLICERPTPFLPSNTGWNRRKGQKSHRGLVRGGKDASRTFPGIANAMAAQWSAHIEALEPA